MVCVEEKDHVEDRVAEDMLDQRDDQAEREPLEKPEEMATQGSRDRQGCKERPAEQGTQEPGDHRASQARTPSTALAPDAQTTFKQPRLATTDTPRLCITGKLRLGITATETGTATAARMAMGTIGDGATIIIDSLLAGIRSVSVKGSSWY